MTQEYLENVRVQFVYYKTLAERAMAQLSEEQLHWQFNPESNSVASIVKHLWGNMLSRWTNFLTEDGEKAWRDREAEFDNDIANREELLQKWDEGWACFFDALSSVNESNFHTIIYIRNMGHTIMEALNRQLAHYGYHIGQIVYIARMLKGPDWESLSIPRGQSTAYNADKFAQEKRRENFTESELARLGKEAKG